MKCPILSSFLFCLFSLSALADGFDSNADHQLGFIENKGQVHDQGGKSRDDVKFIFQKNDFKLILRNSGFSFEFTQINPAGSNFPESGIIDDDEDEDANADLPFLQSINRVDVNFENCNTNAEIVGENPFASYLNYFNQYTGSTGITHVQNFERVVYKNIYDHIDLVFFLEKKDQKLIPHYEFVVNTGGRMKDIQLAYSGQEKISIDKNGVLQLNTFLGFVTSSQPKILSSDRMFLSNCSFIQKGSNISFSKFKSQQTSSFIIDPQIDWGTYYGGMDRDLTDEIACDHLGNIFLTGRTGSTDQLATDGAHQTTLGGYTDAPVIKFDGDGNLLWGTYYGGEWNDVAFAITVDPFNNAWIGGRTVSTHGIATEGAVTDTFAGGYFDVFVAKFSSTGNLLYGTYMGDTLKDEVQSLNTNPEGDIFVSGYSESEHAMSTPGAWKEVGDTAGDDFLLKFSNDAHLLWGTYLGGEKRDRGHGVSVDGYGHIYQFGTSDSHHNFATTGVYQDQNAGLNDAFLAKWTEDKGQLIWCTYFGGEGDERGRDVRVDAAGNVYAIGQTESETGIATPGVWKDTLHYLPTQDRDGFLVKFDSNGNRLWSTYYGGNHIEMPRSLQITPDGSVCYIGGYTKSDSGFSTYGAYNVRRGGGNDAFFLMMNWNGTKLLYSTYYGGGNSESITEGGWYGPTLDLDDNGNIFLSSGTTSSDSIATPDGYKTYVNDTVNYDFFVVKFTNPCTDGFEPQNDSIDTAPALLYNPKTHTFNYKATIEDKTDKDYYSFIKPSQFDNVKVTLTNLPFDCNLWVYDADQNLVGKSQNTGMTNEKVFIPSANSSKYYVLVKSPTKEFSDYNCYTLKILMNYETKESEEGISSLRATVYPNPADGETSLTLDDGANGTYRVTVVNQIGMLVMDEQENFSDNNSMNLRVKDWPSGSYIIRITGKDFNCNKKLIIQH